MPLLRRLLLWFTVTVVTALAVAAAVLIWRVRSGPVSLDFLIPRIKAELAGEEGLSVDVDALELVWKPQERHTELRARGLRISRPAEGASVALAAASVRLKRRELLRGRIVVTAIELDAPALKLVRDTRGRYAMRLDAPSGEARDLGWLWVMMRRLEHVAVRNGRIAFIDEATATTWAVPLVDGDVWRAGGPLRVQVGFTLGTSDGVVPLWVDALYRFEAETLTLQMSTPGAPTHTAFAAWPSTLAPQAHAWVTKHLQLGRIGASVLQVTGHVVRDDGVGLVLDSLDATVPFHGLTVRYVDTMPTATAVGGTARFTRNGADIAVTTGTLEGLDVGPAGVRIGWAPDAQDHIAIDVRSRGPLASLVQVLDHEPVALGQRVRFQSDGIAGTAAARVRLAFPLGGRVTFGKLGLRASATVRDATVPHLEGDWDVTGANATVLVHEGAVAIEGTGQLHGMPATFRFREHFARPGKQRLDVSARLDAPERQALGVDPERWVTGPTDVHIRVAPRRDGQVRATVDVDLTPAALAMSLVGITKAAGEPGRATGRVCIARGSVSTVERFDLDAGGVSIRGAAWRAPDGGPWSTVDADVRYTLPGRRDEEGVMHLELAAEDGGWRTILTSPDVGLVLRGYGYDRVRRGTMTLEGRAVFAEDGTSFDGEITVENTMFSEVPWLVKLMSLASVRGLIGLGSEQVVVVDRLVATLVRKPSGVIEIRDAVARGPQLGLKLQGTIDPGGDLLDLTGTVIPSYYFLNEGADRIPVIGGIIGMATGGAFQAVTFTVKGSRSDPIVAVGALSSLAPGVTREWLRKLGL